MKKAIVLFCVFLLLIGASFLVKSQGGMSQEITLVLNTTTFYVENATLDGVLLLSELESFPACTGEYYGGFARNSSGVYGCSPSAHEWRFLF